MAVSLKSLSKLDLIDKARVIYPHINFADPSDSGKKLYDELLKNFFEDKTILGDTNNTRFYDITRSGVGTFATPISACGVYIPPTINAGDADKVSYLVFIPPPFFAKGYPHGFDWLGAFSSYANQVACSDFSQAYKLDQQYLNFSQTVAPHIPGVTTPLNHEDVYCSPANPPNPRLVLFPVRNISFGIKNRVFSSQKLLVFVFPFIYGEAEISAQFLSELIEALNGEIQAKFGLSAQPSPRSVTVAGFSFSALKVANLLTNLRKNRGLSLFSVLKDVWLFDPGYTTWIHTHFAQWMKLGGDRALRIIGSHARQQNLLKELNKELRSFRSLSPQPLDSQVCDTSECTDAARYTFITLQEKFIEELYRTNPVYNLFLFLNRLNDSDIKNRLLMIKPDITKDEIKNIRNVIKDEALVSTRLIHQYFPYAFLLPFILETQNYVSPTPRRGVLSRFSPLTSPPTESGMQGYR